MAATFTNTVLSSEGNRLVYLLSCAVDGGTTAATTTLDNATLLAAMVASSPLYTLWDASRASAAAAQTALAAGRGRVTLTPSAKPATTTPSWTAAVGVSGTDAQITVAFDIPGAGNGTYEAILNIELYPVAYQVA